MATDGPTPPPCNKKVYNNGTPVFVTHTIPSNAMEKWVKKVAERSGQPVDWHFFGGRAVVKALGDLDKVIEAIEFLLPEHDELYTKECESMGLHGMQPSRYFPTREGL
jgi:hypothetical protein